MSTASWKNQGGFSKHRNVGSVTIQNQKDLSTLNLSLYNHPPPLPDAANYNAGTIVFSDNKLYFKNSLIGWDLISSTGNTAFWSKYLLTTKIYYDQGFVGIGSNSEPMATLDVCGNVIIRGTAIGATGLFTLHGGAVNEKWNAIELISNENGYGPTGTETVIYFSSNDHKVANSESLWHIGMKETGGDLGGYDRFFIGSQHWESEGAGEECLTIAKTGNVGIGATGPTQTLDVSGNVKILGALYDSTDTSGTAGQVLTSTITGTLWAAGGGGSLWTETGSDIYYNTGDVGINNATPGYTLDVGGTVHFSEAIIGAACSGATYSTALGYQSTATSDYATAIGYQANTGTGYAYSMGYRTKAEGYGAALGFRAFADSYQFAIGVSQNLSSATIPDAADNENVLTIRATGSGTSSSTNRETDIVGKLNVTGDVKIDGALYDSANAPGTAGQVLTSTGTGTSWAAGGGGGGNWSTDTNGIHYNSGNVGIGKDSSATVALDIVGDISANTQEYRNQIGYFSSAVKGAIYSKSTAIGYDCIASANYTTAMGYLTTASGDVSTAMGHTTYATGNQATAMGNATTASGVFSTAMGYQTDASGNESTAMGNRCIASGDDSIAMGHYSSTEDQWCTAIGNRAYAGGDIQFAIGANSVAPQAIADAANNNNAFVIDISGNVGISTSGPTHTLDVAGDARFTSQIIAQAFETNGGGVYFESTATEIKRDPSLGLAFITGGENAIKMTLDISGNVGIGATGGATGTNTLFVNGEIRATGDIISFWSSDNRLKTNLEKIEDPLEKLKQINGYTYDWIDNPHIHSHSGRDVGVIAQELDAIGLTGIVKQRDNGYMAVNYDKIIPLLIECIKSQQEQLNKQQEQINALLEK